MRYGGTQDPQEHLKAFEARMSLERVGDEVRCWAFPVTVAGPVIRWFNSLPQGSVATFSDITRAFLDLFTTHIAKATHPINLLGVTQRAGEPTRKYLDRFNDECLEIDGLTHSVASLCLTNRLEGLPETPGSGERPKEHSKDGAPAKTFKSFPQVGKFTNYTLLTAPIVEVYQQITDKGILSKPRQLKDRTGENKNLYCDFHKGYGHTTQDCFDLKDALEQAIREGKLVEFSHFIREPRRQDRDRNGDDKGRVVRQ
ncbi:uncharacterized protein LOC130939976 [Arachis stenosperma]|uniref:uncharacterized protein LOC130939976 n=1 Tax=Arachis stenosperma TaxID=217475 RepID=UPI0025AD060D|nr:uncharacterized protein LOC130939976 [Arachis stenosperma]